MTPETQAFVSELEAMDVHLSIAGENLLLDTPTEDFVTPEMQERLVAAKAEIMAVLRKREPPSKLQIYRALIRGKGVTILDPTGASREEAHRQIRQRFGKALESLS